MKPAPSILTNVQQHLPRIHPPTVDPEFRNLSGLQRATESLRYVLLRWEFWVSPSGDMRQWLRHNSRVGALLFIPAVLVMPVVGFILWQLTGWLSMLTTIFGHLIVLPVLVLLALVVIRTALALLKR